MLYNFKFTIFNHNGSIYREDIIIAATAADAQLLYNTNIYESLGDSGRLEEIEPKNKSIFSYQLSKKRISIECIEELKVVKSTNPVKPPVPAHYKWRFSILHKDKRVLQEDTVIAETAISAIHLYSEKLKTSKNRLYQDFEEALQTNFVDRMIMDCLGIAEAPASFDSEITYDANYWKNHPPIIIAEKGNIRLVDLNCEKTPIYQVQEKGESGWIALPKDARSYTEQWFLEIENARKLYAEYN